MLRTSAMASLTGAPGCESFHSFMWARTKRLYALGARFGLSSLSKLGEYGDEWIQINDIPAFEVLALACFVAAFVLDSET